MNKSSWPILLACSLIALVACQCCLGALQTGLAAPDVASDLPPTPPPSENLGNLERKAREHNSSVRANFNMPKMFNFELFKSAFNKHYTTALEEMARIKLFMANAYRAFVSALKYKYRKASYYLAVNSRSDWTPEEFEAIRMKPGTYEEPELDVKDYEGELSEGEDSDHNEQPELKSQLQQQQQQLEPIAKRSSLRKKRAVTLDVEPVRQASPDSSDYQATDMAPVPDSWPDEIEPKEYLGGPKVANRKSLDELDLDPDYKPLYERKIKVGKARYDYNKLPVKSNHKSKNNPQAGTQIWFLRRVYARVSDEVYKKLGLAAKNANEEEEEEEEEEDDNQDDAKLDDDDEQADVNADIVWVDHRQSDCLFPVQDQGWCGSCYAFAAIAYLEWAYCKETGRQTKLSEQYVVDCGPRMEQLNGCAGGHVLQVGTFANNFGLELASNYPHAVGQATCRYGDDVPMIFMGHIRVDMLMTRWYPLKRIEAHLASTPMIVNIGTRGDFVQYGGGVWDGANCGDHGDHSVLLIGHGREDGEEYWLIRNSYGEDFGESGHLKLNKNSKCILPRSGIAFGSHLKAGVRLYASDNANKAELLNNNNNNNNDSAVPLN